MHSPLLEEECAVKNGERRTPVLHLAALLRLQHLQQPLDWTSSKVCQGQMSTFNISVCTHVCIAQEVKGRGYGHVCKNKHRPRQVCFYFVVAVVTATDSNSSAFSKYISLLCLALCACVTVCIE